MNAWFRLSQVVSQILWLPSPVRDSVWCKPPPPTSLSRDWGKVRKLLKFGTDNVSLGVLLAFIASFPSFLFIWLDEYMVSGFVLELCRLARAWVIRLHGTWYCGSFRGEFPLKPCFCESCLTAIFTSLELCTFKWNIQVQNQLTVVFCRNGILPRRVSLVVIWT